MKHGKGTDIFANGDCYTGNYAFGKADGKGVYKWKNGSIYSGEFKEGMKHGRGEWKKVANSTLEESGLLILLCSVFVACVLNALFVFDILYFVEYIIILIYI